LANKVDGPRAEAFSSSTPSNDQIKTFEDDDLGVGISNPSSRHIEKRYTPMPGGPVIITPVMPCDDTALAQTVSNIFTWDSRTRIDARGLPQRYGAGAKGTGIGT
jgi:hypothetical protein